LHDEPPALAMCGIATALGDPRSAKCDRRPRKLATRDEPIERVLDHAGDDMSVFWTAYN
jgi:hypothetical protein